MPHMYCSLPTDIGGGIGLSEAGVSGCCGPPDVDAGNQFGFSGRAVQMLNL